MLVIFGSRLYGKTLVVPGELHVATLFAHFCYIPLLPRASWVVVSQERSLLSAKWKGFELPEVFWPSARLAWLRALLWILLANVTPLALVSLVAITGSLLAMFPILAAGTLGYVLWRTYRDARATEHNLEVLYNYREVPVELLESAKRALKQQANQLRESLGPRSHR